MVTRLGDITGISILRLDENASQQQEPFQDWLGTLTTVGSKAASQIRTFSVQSRIGSKGEADRLRDLVNSKQPTWFEVETPTDNYDFFGYVTDLQLGLIAGQQGSTDENWWAGFTFMDLPYWGTTTLVSGVGRFYDSGMRGGLISFNPRHGNYNWVWSRTSGYYQYDFIVANRQEETSGARTIQSGVTGTDDAQASFWTATSNITLSNDSAVKQKGVDALRIAVGATPATLNGFYNNLGSADDFRNLDFFSFWWLGTNTNATWQLGFSNIAGANTDIVTGYQHSWLDDWQGYRHVVLPRRTFTVTGANASWSGINKVLFRLEGTGASASTDFYLDRLVAESGHWVYFETQSPPLLDRSTLSGVSYYSWSGSDYQLFGGTFHTSPITKDLTSGANLFTLSVTGYNSLYATSSGAAWFAVAQAGKNTFETVGDSDATGISYSTEPNTRTRIGFALKMAPATFTSGTAGLWGVDKVRLRVRAWYGNEFTEVA